MVEDRQGNGFTSFIPPCLSRKKKMEIEDLKDQLELMKKSIQKALGHASRIEQLLNAEEDLKDD